MKLYPVTSMRKPEFDPAAIEPHSAFLQRLREEGRLQLAGPFIDKSGGAYLIRAGDHAEARKLADQDPVHTTCSSLVTVYEWDAK